MSVNFIDPIRLFEILDKPNTVTEYEIKTMVLMLIELAKQIQTNVEEKLIH